MAEPTSRPSRRTVILLAVVMVVVLGIAVAAVVARRGDDDAATVTEPSASCDDRPTVAVAIDLADGFPEIFLARPGEALRPLLPGQIVRQPAFSPDGERLAVVVSDGDYESAGPNATAITVVDPDGTHPESLTPLGPALDDDPAWSPDGQALAFVRAELQTDHYRWSLLTVPAAGGAPTALQTEDDVTRFGAPTWSPEGTQLAFIRTTDAPGLSGALSSVWIVGIDGGAPRELAAVPGAFSLDWSPDGAHILVGSPPALPTSLVEVSTGGVETVGASLAGPRWSTRADRIVGRRKDGAIVEQSLGGSPAEPEVLLAPADLPPSTFGGRGFPEGDISVAPCPG